MGEVALAHRAPHQAHHITAHHQQVVTLLIRHLQLHTHIKPQQQLTLTRPHLHLLTRAQQQLPTLTKHQQLLIRIRHRPPLIRHQQLQHTIITHTHPQPHTTHTHHQPVTVTVTIITITIHRHTRRLLLPRIAITITHHLLHTVIIAVATIRAIIPILHLNQIQRPL